MNTFLSAQRASRSSGDRLGRWPEHKMRHIDLSPGRCPGLREQRPFGPITFLKGTLL
jgi:hypothetical protein